MTQITNGILQKAQRGAGKLVDPTQLAQDGSSLIHVPAEMIRAYGLVEGARVAGPIRQSRQNAELTAVESICGLDPDVFQRRLPYQGLTAVDPCERFRLGDSGEASMRIVDLIAPIGKGTRGLIAAPPKAGKTLLLAQMARAIHASHPDTRIIALLIDERPEEVTQFRRTVEAEVFASSNDNQVRDHIALAELTMAYVRTELECGHDVVILMDSITRMGRAFNIKGSGTRRTLSGGLEAGALEIPRRFFGLARNIEGGGSVTIIATALIETGSRLDDVIYEEFKSTGNSEIVLDRSLAEARIFPAINIPASGTRKEEHLHGPEVSQQVAKLRRGLAKLQPKPAMALLLRLLEKFPTNEDLLRNIPVRD